MTASAAFLRAVAIVLAHEGGYVNDPNDPGGETNFGISKRRYPDEDIKGMTAARATDLYHSDFWLAVRGDELPPALALQVFDMAVNAGPGTAIKILQEVLGATIDGVLGPKTLAAAAASGRSHAVRYARERIDHYAKLAGWSRFGRAWGIRTVETLAHALE